MTREEALKEIRSWAFASKRGLEVLETLIPEMCKENANSFTDEDEEIRKSLVEYFSKFNPADMWDNNYSFSQILAYLEKQKERTPADGWDYADKRMSHPLYLEGFEAGRAVERESSEPAAEWSEDFEENIRTLLHNKLTWHSEDGKMSSTVFIDDKTLKDIISGIWFYVGKEALKYPNKEIHVQEWSEEDEKIMRTMIKDGDLKPSEIAWLKSLRPSWKPSEEQPEVGLEKALDEYYKNADFGPSEAIEYEIHKDIARHFYELGKASKEDEV